MQYEDEALFDKIDAFLDPFFSGRAIFSAVLFYVGLNTLGVEIAKSLSICLMVYLLHVFRFGNRQLEQVAMLMLALGIVSWAQIVPVQEIVARLKTLAAR